MLVSDTIGTASTAWLALALGTALPRDTDTSARNPGVGYTSAKRTPLLTSPLAV